MPLQLEQLQWSDAPLVPQVADPAWDAEVKPLFGGMMPTSLSYTASSPWVRRAILDCIRSPVAALSLADVELAEFVTAQENACRYCYGVTRVRMRMLGFSDEMIDRIERNAQLVEADPRERELVRFCRDLARSKPRPSRKAREAMTAAGFSPLETAELALVVAFGGFCNRSATLLAVPPELEFEEMGRQRPKGLWHKLSSWLPSRHEGLMLPPPNYPPARGDGPFGTVVRSLEGSPGASVIEVALEGAFSPRVLSRRAVSLVFAVIARTLECDVCEDGAATLLAQEGFSLGSLHQVLASLGSPELTEIESLIVPWARDTVWMPEQPARIQERTRPLLAALGPEGLVETVGTAALANSCVRLTMLQL